MKIFAKPSLGPPLPCIYISSVGRHTHCRPKAYICLREKKLMKKINVFKFLWPLSNILIVVLRHIYVWVAYLLFEATQYVSSTPLMFWATHILLPSVFYTLL